jgi:hypothetical protein
VIRKLPSDTSGVDRRADAYAKGATVVREALAVRDGTGKGEYLKNDRRFENEELSRVRHMQVSGNSGRLIIDETRRYLLTTPMTTVSQTNHQNRVAETLADWCRRRKIPAVIEAMTAHFARKFLRHLGSKGLSERTIENYRSSLRGLWAYVLWKDAEFLRFGNFPESFRISTPIENPWALRFAPVASRKTRVSRKPTRANANLNKQGLSRGLSAAKKEADRRALEIQPILRRIRRSGVLSAKGIARALNGAGQRTARGKYWDATAVLRVEARLRQIDDGQG